MIGKEFLPAKHAKFSRKGGGLKAFACLAVKKTRSLSLRQRDFDAIEGGEDGLADGNFDGGSNGFRPFGAAHGKQAHLRCLEEDWPQKTRKTTKSDADIFCVFLCFLWLKLFLHGSRLGLEALKVKIGGQFVGHGGSFAMTRDDPGFRRQGFGQFFERGGQCACVAAGQVGAAA